MKQVSPEVYYSDDEVVTVAPPDIAFLRARVGESPRGRIRICTHRGAEDALHEMFIAISRRSYIRPHRHHGKAESFAVLDGAADFLMFDERGAITDIIEVGGADSGKRFYVRTSTPVYHTFVLRTDTLVIHEVTGGPYRPENTEFAAFAPAEQDAAAAASYMARLAADADRFKQNSKRDAR